MNRINVRLPKELFDRLRRSSRVTGLPMSLIVRNSIERGLSQKLDGRLLKYAGLIKGGPSDLSSRKGFRANNDDFRVYRRNKREAIPLLTPPKSR